MWPPREICVTEGPCDKNLGFVSPNKRNKKVNTIHTDLTKGSHYPLGLRKNHPLTLLGEFEINLIVLM
jgi:hypothetical protein